MNTVQNIAAGLGDNMLGGTSRSSPSRVSPVVIELAGVPIGKGRPRFVRSTGAAFTPPRTRNYESMLRYAAQMVMAGRSPLNDALAVEVRATFPIPQSWSQRKRAAALAGDIHPTTKPDPDNILKVLDALAGVVFVDDKQIVEARIAKVYGHRPGLRIEIGERSRLGNAASAAGGAP